MLARSRAIDRLRARRARPDMSVAEENASRIVDTRPPIDWQLLSSEQAARLRDALEDLPVLQRVAIELAYFEGLTQSEIAGRLAEPLGTIKTRIRLGLLKLRDALTGSPAGGAA
jgi:RNA polymerase sigma-70 factor (ECF subfamily)